VPNGSKPAVVASNCADPLDTIPALIEASVLGGAIRRSVWIYPVVNVLHVLGVMALFAIVAAMDVRVLCGKSDGARAFIARLRPRAVAALVLMVATGFLLFAPEATHIIDNPVFRLKLVVIVIALFNVGVLELALRRSAWDEPIPAAAKGAAVASLVLWLCVAALGRLIAYF